MHVWICEALSPSATGLFKVLQTCRHNNFGLIFEGQVTSFRDDVVHLVVTVPGIAVFLTASRPRWHVIAA